MPKVGSQNPQAKSGGTWKGWSNFWGRHSGIWKKPLSVHVRSGGSWVKVWDERPVITNVSTFLFDEGELYYAYKYATISANGFDTTVTGSYSGGGGGSFGEITPTSISANGTASVTAFNNIAYGYPVVYPDIQATNASGSASA